MIFSFYPCRNQPCMKIPISCILHFEQSFPTSDHLPLQFCLSSSRLLHQDRDQRTLHKQLGIKQFRHDLPLKSEAQIPGSFAHPEMATSIWAPYGITPPGKYRKMYQDKLSFWSDLLYSSAISLRGYGHIIIPYYWLLHYPWLNQKSHTERVALFPLKTLCIPSGNGAFQNTPCSRISAFYGTAGVTTMQVSNIPQTVRY